MNMTRSLPDRINRLFHRFAQVAIGLLLCVGLAGGGATASAQVSPENGESASPRWQANFDLQMAHVLREEPILRTSALKVIIQQVPESEDLRLPQTTEALLDVIEDASSQRQQLMVVQALSAIGPEHVREKRYRRAMNRLYAFAEETAFERVRGAVADAISRYQAS